MRLTHEDIPEIDAEQAAGLMAGRPEGSYILIDVRQPEEYERGHLPAARLIPLPELESKAGSLERDRPVIAYCRSGNRSRSAAHLLRRLGFAEVYSMAGGITGWAGGIQGRERPVAGGWPRVELFSGREDLTTALNLVFFMERGSEGFYRQAAGKAENPAVARLLSELAAAETVHMRAVYARLSALHEEMPSFEEFRELADSDMIEGALRPEEYLGRAEGLAFADEAHILEQAMELEALGLDLYRALAAQAEDEGVRRTLFEMCDQERGHLRSLAERLGQISRA